MQEHEWAQGGCRGKGDKTQRTARESQRKRSCHGAGKSAGLHERLRRARGRARAREEAALEDRGQGQGRGTTAVSPAALSEALTGEKT